ncbi:helicase SNF2 [Variovorax saccharolyticus]|uniref:helicase SNF2 n=1 Tax=Variovorax saccharolyticus TaxID=3053516 RepID=UPI00257768EE|nr:helicase SNF2 [Variovorax sp. J22R187]MDM0022822.1 helicase SNF2 [Variovorax sp. J22R187]
MKSKTLFALAIVGMLAAVGAQAETYDGVHPITDQASRATVRAGAVYAADHADPYDDGAQSGVSTPFVSTVTRSYERAQAVKAAHSPNPYADGYDAGVPAPIVSTVSRSAVRAQATSAAHALGSNAWGEAY